MLPDSKFILGVRVDGSTYEQTVAHIVQMAMRGPKGYVCVANVHMIMEAYDDDGFRSVVNRAAIVTSDGMPLLWGLRLLGVSNAERVYGPELTLRLCSEAAQKGIPVGFYGAHSDVLQRMKNNLVARYPSINVAYMHDPPFQPLSSEEDARIVEDIGKSGVKIFFVGLGCPKQERWMAQHVDKLQVVMIGVGAAFDFISGVKPQAPHWVQKLGFEWLFRLATEPGRLWRRYLFNNPRFLIKFAAQLWRERVRTHT